MPMKEPVHPGRIVRGALEDIDVRCSHYTLNLSKVNYFDLLIVNLRIR